MLNCSFKKVVITILWAVAATGIVLCGGCTSYRFAGKVLVPVNERHILNNKYRIVRLVFERKTQLACEAPIAIDPWSLPQVAALCDIESIRLKIMQRHPEVFADDFASTPVSVKVLTTSEHTNYAPTIVAPFLISLGILPAWMETVSSCEAFVAIEAHNAPKPRQVPLSFTSILKMTCFSPIGLIEFDDKPDMNSQRKGAGIMQGPHMDVACRDALCDVVIETLSGVVASAVMQMDAEK